MRCETEKTSNLISDNPKSQSLTSQNLKSQSLKSQSLTSHILKPYFAAMIYPVVSMEDPICHKKSRRNLLGKNYSDELKQKMSLEKNVHADVPPIFLMHCTDDKTVDCRNSTLFSNALTKNNIKHKSLLFEEKGHGFGIRPHGKATGWMDEFLKWVLSI
jgi:acetyl esterase/lipase